jgi:hypothetical protein
MCVDLAVTPGAKDIEIAILESIGPMTERRQGLGSFAFTAATARSSIALASAADAWPWANAEPLSDSRWRHAERRHESA